MHLDFYLDSYALEYVGYIFILISNFQSVLFWKMEVLQFDKIMNLWLGLWAPRAHE